MKPILKIISAVLVMFFFTLTSCDLDNSKKTVVQNKKNTVNINAKETQKEKISTLEIDAKKSANISCEIKKIMENNSKKAQELARNKYDINTQIWEKYKNPEEREKFSIAVVKFLKDCEN